MALMLFLLATNSERENINERINHKKEELQTKAIEKESRWSADTIVTKMLRQEHEKEENLHNLKNIFNIFSLWIFSSSIIACIWGRVRLNFISIVLKWVAETKLCRYMRWSYKKRFLLMIYKKELKGDWAHASSRII